MKKEPFNINSARNISIEKVLKDMGHLPKRVNNHNLWYNSPLRFETQPSFKVNQSLNRWYDFGSGEGGNAIDLLIKMYGFSCTEALKYLSKYASNDSFSFDHQTEKHQDKPQIIDVKRIQHPALIQYLTSRKIPKSVYELFCEEVHYKANGKHYFGVGFSNDSGGFEIRSRFFKGCIGSKDITTMKGTSNKLFLYEGFFDFISHITVEKAYSADANIIILNSVANISKILPQLDDQNYYLIETFFDNDPAGDKGTDTISKHANMGIYDGRKEYQNYKDWNDYVMNVF